MKIALISDIHSNTFYLEEIMVHIEREKVDRTFCLGDIVGYYDKPEDAVKMCMKYNIIPVKGNHEKYLLGEANYSPEKEKVFGVKRQRKTLKDDSMEFLLNLPDCLDIEISGKKFYLTHSLPNDCFTYCYGIDGLDKNFIARYDYYCFGHTHIPLISYHEGTCVLNPGSAGQPRDYTRLPSFIIVDLINNSITLHRVVVDYGIYIQKLKEADFDNSLVKILIRSKQWKR